MNRSGTAIFFDFLPCSFSFFFFCQRSFQIDFAFTQIMVSKILHNTSHKASEVRFYEVCGLDFDESVA